MEVNDGRARPSPLLEEVDSAQPASRENLLEEQGKHRAAAGAD